MKCSKESIDILYNKDIEKEKRVKKHIPDFVLNMSVFVIFYLYRKSVHLKGEVPFHYCSLRQHYSIHCLPFLPLLL